MKIKAIKQQTLAQKIAAALTDRKILHFRYDANLRKQLYPHLDKLQKNLLNRLTAAGVESLPKRELNRLLGELKQQISDTYQTISQMQAVELDRFFAVEHQALTALYNDAVQFDLFNQVPEYKLKAMKNTPLIAGTPLEDWWSKQASDYRFRFEGTVRQGLLDGKQTSQIVTEIKTLAQTQRRHAETLVITSVGKVADNAHQALRDANEDLIKGEQQLSTLDLRTSSICQVRDGLRWDVNKNPIGHNYPYQRPPLHPRCRSILQLWLKSWKELGIEVDERNIPPTERASVDGPVDGNLNYEQWLKGKSPTEQDEVLGKGKADLWRRGVITFRDMLDQSGRPLTLEQLQDLSNIPEVVRAIRRRNWTEQFKTRLEKVYLELHNAGIELDIHAVGRFGDRIKHLSIEEVKDLLLSSREPNYYDQEQDRDVWLFPEKKLAVVKSKIDNKIITFMAIDKERSKWTRIK